MRSRRSRKTQFPCCRLRTMLVRRARRRRIRTRRPAPSFVTSVLRALQSFAGMRRRARMISGSRTDHGALLAAGRIRRLQVRAGRCSAVRRQHAGSHVPAGRSLLAASPPKRCVRSGDGYLRARLSHALPPLQKKHGPCCRLRTKLVRRVLKPTRPRQLACSRLSKRGASFALTVPRARLAARTC